jgi:hypothetical protein
LGDDDDGGGDDDDVEDGGDDVFTDPLCRRRNGQQAATRWRLLLGLTADDVFVRIVEWGARGGGAALAAGGLPGVRGPFVPALEKVGGKLGLREEALGKQAHRLPCTVRTPATCRPCALPPLPHARPRILWLLDPCFSGC